MKSAQIDGLPTSSVHCSSVQASSNLIRIPSPLMATHRAWSSTESTHRQKSPALVSPQGMLAQSEFAGQAPQVPDTHAWPLVQVQLPPQPSGKLHGVPVQSGMQHRPPRHVPLLRHGVPSGNFFRHLPFLQRLQGPHFFLHLAVASRSTPWRAAKPATTPKIERRVRKVLTRLSKR